MGNTISFIGILVIVVGLGFILNQVINTSKDIPTDVCIRYETITNGGRFTPTGSKTCTLSLEKVDTKAAREQGLSGQSSIPNNRGMLFVFDHIDRQCMWMKDMKFNLDIAWLDAQGNVVKLEENLSPNTYPAEYCANNVLFVIEVNAGVAEHSGLSIGSRVNL